MRTKLIVGIAVLIGYIGFLIKNILKRNFRLIKTTNPIKTYNRIISYKDPFGI